MAGSYVQGIGTFENPQTVTTNWRGERVVNVGGTVRDQYGRDLLASGNKYGMNANASQDLEKQRLAARESGNSSSSTNSSTSSNDSLTYSVWTAKSLIEKWKRGESLSSPERAIVRKYLSTIGYYGGEEEAYDDKAERDADEFAKQNGLPTIKRDVAYERSQLEKANSTGFNQLMSSYVSSENSGSSQKTSLSSGGNGSSWTVSNPVSVTTKAGKKMTDSSTWKRY